MAFSSGAGARPPEIVDRAAEHLQDPALRKASEPPVSQATLSNDAIDHYPPTRGSLQEVLNHSALSAPDAPPQSGGLFNTVPTMQDQQAQATYAGMLAAAQKLESARLVQVVGKAARAKSKVEMPQTFAGPERHTPVSAGEDTAPPG